MSATSSAGKLKQLADAALKATQCGDYAIAKECYHQATTLAPDNSTLLFNYASLARIMGELRLAEKLLDKVVRLTPQDTAAWLMRSQLQRWDINNNHIHQLEDTLKKLPVTGSPKQRVELHYALCKEYEDCEQFSLAKEHLEAGADLRRRHINYDINDDLATLAALKDTISLSPSTEHYDKQFANAPVPVFIISLPRAGSTLLERMLSTDENVYAAGELPYFPQLLGRALQKAYLSTNPTRSRPSNKAELVGYAHQINWQQLGRDYLAQLPKKPWVIDKLPMNYLNIGFIQRALPHARIIYLQRDTDDHELALLKHLFNQAYPWSYSRHEIRQYREAVEALCETANEQPSNDIHCLTYEQLIMKPQQTLEAVASYCGLNWSTPAIQSAIAFNKSNQAPSTTGSATQIRRSLHQRSIGLSEKYGF